MSLYRHRKTGPYVALGSRLKGVSEVITLGVRPNFHDYTPFQRALLERSEIILFPTLNYAQFFSTMGKPIFPSLETHLYADEKIKQTTLFYMLEIPHPHTRFYFPLHHQDILKDFTFPFVAKLPRCSAQGRGVFKIHNREEFESYLRLTRVAYVQEYLKHDRDLRVVLIDYDPVLAYWRTRSPQDFRTNLFCGGAISFDGIPPEGVRFATEVAMKCRFDDVGLDLIHSNGRWYVIEANMKYGRKGLRIKGLNPKQIIREKLRSGELLARTNA